MLEASSLSALIPSSSSSTCCSPLRRRHPAPQAQNLYNRRRLIDVFKRLLPQPAPLKGVRQTAARSPRPRRSAIASEGADARRQIRHRPRGGNVQRVPAAPSNLVEPTGGHTGVDSPIHRHRLELPCNSSLMRAVLSRIDNAVCTAARACLSGSSVLKNDHQAIA